METFSALLAICAGNSTVPSEFPTQRPVTRSFDVFFDVYYIMCYLFIPMLYSPKFVMFMSWALGQSHEFIRAIEVVLMEKVN